MLFRSVLCIIYKGRTNIRGTTFFCPVLTEGAFLGMRPKAGISLRGNGRSRRGLARGETQRSGRSSKAIFSGVPAPLSSIPRLSGAGFCRVLSFSQPFFHHYHLHFTLYFCPVSTEKGKKLERPWGFCPQYPPQGLSALDPFVTAHMSG